MAKKMARPSRVTGFLAVVRYELLWNIRKKKFLGILVLAFGLASLTLFLPVILNNANNLPTEPNPNYVITTGTGVGSFGFFLFALVTVMNSISGEFESGSIVPLLTKPVSRTTIYLGKLFAAILTVLAAFILLTIYMAAGGYFMYGAQNDMHLIVITLLGSLLSTLVWMSIVLAAGSVSKSSMLTALLAIGIFFGLTIASGVLSSFSNQAWVLTYAPGNGAQAFLGNLGTISINITAISNVTSQSVSTGTDGVGAGLVTYILHPTENVTFTKTEIMGRGQEILVPVYSEPLSIVLARSIAVAAIYILVFNFIAWYALKRTQVTE
jgi:ABC-type transport system involved in multi-copper enzyme maturation permease subunit